MRQNAIFAGAVAGSVLLIGFGLIGLGVAEAQANAHGGTLNLWGNAWFVLGFCFVIAGVAGLIASVVMYVRRPRKGTKSAGGPVDTAKIGPIPWHSSPLEQLIREGWAIQALLGPPQYWNVARGLPEEFNQRCDSWLARVREALEPYPGRYEQVMAPLPQDYHREWGQGPRGGACALIQQGIGVLQRVIDGETFGW